MACPEFYGDNGKARSSEAEEAKGSGLTGLISPLRTFPRSAAAQPRFTWKISASAPLCLKYLDLCCVVTFRCDAHA